MKLKEKFNKVYGKLDKEYPDADIQLNYSNPLELLIATILAAQSTDERVNKVTEKLFEKYPGAEDYAKADLDELMEDIYSTGFYKNKAKNIKKAANKIVDEHNGKVPDNMDDLVDLPGVGRKTANVVLGNSFGKPAIMVDTHVKRVTNRVGLTDEDKPDKIEKDLKEIIPDDKRTRFSHLITSHGRKICKSRKPKCSDCVVFDYCDYYDKNVK